VKLGKPDLEPEVSEPSDFSIDLVLADLLASQKKTSAEAFERLSELAQAHPESADVQESLGYLAWQQGDTTKAREKLQTGFRPRIEKPGDAGPLRTALA
jgi:Flp pilus assembly protein TadD